MNALIQHAHCRRQAQLQLLEFLNANTLARLRPAAGRVWATLLSLLLFSQPALAETDIDELHKHHENTKNSLLEDQKNKHQAEVQNIEARIQMHEQKF